MEFPAELSRDYPSVALVPGRERAWYATDTQNRQYVVKLAHLSSLPVFEFLAAIDPPCPHLAIPVRWGTTAGWAFSVTPRYPTGDLKKRLAALTPYPLGELRALVQQLNLALAALHRPDAFGRHLVHSDLKPSNVLLDLVSDGTARFALADFDAAFLVDGEQITPFERKYTLRYAAPEQLVRMARVTTKADYWSLGMMVLHALRGVEPFRGWSDADITTSLGTSWQAPFDAVNDERWRALLGGLLNRSIETRWDGELVSRWLQGDGVAISEGLGFSGERPARVPIVIHGEPIFSANALARKLLRDEVCTVDIREICRWLREQVGRSDVADRFESQPQGDPDLRLLELCRSLLPRTDFPCVWRGQEVSAANLANAAHAALSGDIACQEWLRSLRDGPCFDFYAHADFSPEIRGLRQRFNGAIRQYTEAWNAIELAGAPAVRPAPERLFAEAIQMTFDANWSRTLERMASTLFQADQILLRHSWFLTFGTDPGRISVYQLNVLRALNEVSLASRLNVRLLDPRGGIDRSRLTEGVAMPQSHHALMRSLVVRAGSPVIELREGATFSPAPPRSAADHVRERVRAAYVYVRSRIAALLLRPFPRNIEAALNLSVRLIRVSSNNRHQAPEFLHDEAYLAHIMWRQDQDSENTRVTLCLDRPGLLGTTPRLRLRNLPGAGQIQLILMSDTLITLRVRRSGSWRSAPSHPVAILFSWKPRLIRSEKKIRSSEERVLTAHPGPLSTIDRLLSPEPLVRACSAVITHHERDLIKPSDWRSVES